PYLLVGHSLGGLYARHYAQRFPDEVAALLLLDPAHEDYDACMSGDPNEMRKARGSDQPTLDRSRQALVASARKQLFGLLGRALAGALRFAPPRALLLRLPVIQRYRRQYRALFAREMADWPEHIREMLIERHVSPEWLLVSLQEVSN